MAKRLLCVQSRPSGLRLEVHPLAKTLKSLFIISSTPKPASLSFCLYAFAVSTRLSTARRLKLNAILAPQEAGHQVSQIGAALKGGDPLTPLFPIFSVLH